LNDLIGIIKRRRKSELSPLRRFFRGQARLRQHSNNELEQAQRRTGLTFPASFVEFYRHIGSGDFGPGYGFLPLLPPNEPTEGNVVDRYLLFRNGDPEEPEFHWPEGLLQFCHWGCAIYSCIDCRSGAILRADPPSDVNYVIEPESESFEQWMYLWLDNKLPFELESIKRRTEGLE